MRAARSTPASIRRCALGLALMAAPASAFAQAPTPPAPAPATPPEPAPVPALVAGFAPDSALPTLEQELRAAPEQEPPPPPDPRDSAPYFPLNVALLHPMSSNAGIPDLRTNLALGVILDRVGYVDGLQLSAVSSITHDLHGLQLGAADLVDGTAEGIQVGGVFAFSGGALQGAQIAGLMSWADTSLQGLQLAGLINRTTRPIEGAQIAGLSNWANESFTGLQVAGGINQTRGAARGVQIAGALNAAYGNLDGVQIGAFNIGKVRGLQLGLINVSADTQGTQIGVINIARRSEGLQVGVVNITDNLKGESLGLASLPRAGGIHLVVWGSNSLSGNLGVKFASKVVYSILSGVIHREDKSNVYGGGFTLGVHFPVLASVTEGLSVAADFGAYRLVRDPAPVTRHDEIYKARLLVSYEVAKHFSFFAGGGARASVRGDDVLATGFGPEICGGLDL